MALMLGTMPTVAFSQQVCPGLTGQARTNCLNAEVARQRANTDRQNRTNQRLDTAIRGTNAVNSGARAVGIAAGAAAGAVAGGSAGGPGGAVVGGVAGGAAVNYGYDATGRAIQNSSQCRGTGNSETAGSTPQRCR